MLHMWIAAHVLAFLSSVLGARVNIQCVSDSQSNSIGACITPSTTNHAFSSTVSVFRSTLTDTPPAPTFSAPISTSPLESNAQLNGGLPIIGVLLAIVVMVLLVKWKRAGFPLRRKPAPASSLSQPTVDAPHLQSQQIQSMPVASTTTTAGVGRDDEILVERR
ncbi:hypothetical protein B0H13DRAFT_1909178 [Mycena leptocephala]|nr:hypothetical protein B0H13DRAFT_1909178 [Mycena leptocephala]